VRTEIQVGINHSQLEESGPTAGVGREVNRGIFTRKKKALRVGSNTRVACVQVGSSSTREMCQLRRVLVAHAEWTTLLGDPSFPGEHPMYHRQGLDFKETGLGQLRLGTDHSSLCRRRVITHCEGRGTGWGQRKARASSFNESSFRELYTKEKRDHRYQSGDYVVLKTTVLTRREPHKRADQAFSYVLSVAKVLLPSYISNLSNLKTEIDTTKSTLFGR